MNTKTFEQCAEDPISTVYLDEHADGYRLLILRGPSSVCAYVGVPESHPLAKVKSYDALPLRVHGGLTFAGTHEDIAPGWFFWGWDYGHSGDKSFYDLDGRFSMGREAGTDWTPQMVKEDSWPALSDFGSFVKLAEQIAAASTSLPVSKGVPEERMKTMPPMQSSRFNLWRLLHDEHGILALETELQDIIEAARECHVPSAARVGAGDTPRTKAAEYSVNDEGDDPYRC